MKDRIFENALNVIRNYLKEEVAPVTPPTNNASDGNISGLLKDPPVYLNKPKKLPALTRRTSSGKREYPS